MGEGDATRYKNVLATFIGQAVNELRFDNDAVDLAPVGFVLDEAANVPLVGLKEIAGVGRGRRIGLILGYQNLPQVHDQYGQEGGNAILGSIGTMIFLPGLDSRLSLLRVVLVRQRFGVIRQWMVRERNWITSGSRRLAGR